MTANYSVPLLADTGKRGDVRELHDSFENPPQPDFGDIGGALAAFTESSTGYQATKVQAQMQPNTAIPARPVDFKDIASVVAAFIGSTYVQTVPNAGPCACPSDVTCAATSCAFDLQCGAGFCIDSFCTDQCGRCAP